MATPPTRVLYSTPALGYGSGTTPKTTPTFDVVAGDLITLVASTEDSTTTVGTPTSTGSITWTLRQSVVVTSYCVMYAYTGVVNTTQTGITVTAARGVGTGQYSFGVTVWRNHGGVGLTGKTNVASGAPSLALSCSANSAVVVGSDDWNAADGTTRTWRTVNGSPITESLYFRNASTYTVYSGYRADTGAAGSQTLGLSAPAAQKYSIVAIEVLGTSTSGQTTTPSGLGVTADLGTPTVQQTVPVGGVSATATPGAVSVAQAVAVAGIAAVAALGAVAVAQVIPVAGISQPTSVGTVAVAQTVPVAGVSVPVGIGSPTTGSTQTTSPTGVSVVTALGVPAVHQRIPVSGVAVPTGLGAPSVVQGQAVTVAGISAPVGIGSPAVRQTVPVVGVSVPVGIGAPSTLQGQSTSPTGIGVPTALGTPTVRQTVPVTGIAVTVAIGTATTSQGGQVTNPAGFSAPVLLGTVAVRQTITPPGAASVVAVGVVAVQQRVPVAGVPVSIGFGTPTATAAGDAVPVTDPALSLTLPASDALLTLPASTAKSTNPQSAAVVAVPTSRSEPNVDGYTRNDTGPDLIVTLSSKPVVPLTGATVKVRIRKPGSVAAVQLPGGQVTLDANARTVTIKWAVGDLAVAGRYRLEVEVTYSNTMVQTFPGAVFYVADELV